MFDKIKSFVTKNSSKPYEIREIEDIDHYIIDLIDYPISYYYNHIKMNEFGQLKYDIEVISNDNNLDTNSEEMNCLFGYILLDLIDEGEIDEGEIVEVQ